MYPSTPSGLRTAWLLPVGCPWSHVLHRSRQPACLPSRFAPWPSPRQRPVPPFQLVRAVLQVQHAAPLHQGDSPGWQCARPVSAARHTIASAQLASMLVSFSVLFSFLPFCRYFVLFLPLLLATLPTRQQKGNAAGNCCPKTATSRAWNPCVVLHWPRCA